MKKFLINIILFLLLATVIGEFVVRLTHAVSDIPQRVIDEHGIQKYFPNQEGYWKGGDHKWAINKLGWPGKLPKNYDRLIMIIGDSFIENFMNPIECHQSIFLKEYMENYNFMEASRSGISLIEAMEISNKIDSLKPIHTLIYVKDDDFYESISEIEQLDEITQLSVKKDSIRYGAINAPKFKKALYNWKLLFYFYNRFPLNSLLKTKSKSKDSFYSSKNEEKYNTEVSQLIDYISHNYVIKNITLVFHPNSNESIIETCISFGFNIILLDSSNDKPWTFDYDSHWTCYGHKRAAQQISKKLINSITQDPLK